MSKSENPKPIQHHWKIKENERCIVYIHEYPSTPGVIVVASKSDSKGADLFQLPFDDYECLMMEARDIAPVLQQKLKVQRCALISEPSTLPAHLKIIPMHGLDNVWEPVTSAEEEYNEEYPGYVSSKNGPRRSNEELDRIKKTIVSSSSSSSSKGAVSNVFHGEASDNNLFARIVRNEEEHWRVWEDDDHVAFLTPFPNTPGFTVLVPRRHLSSDIFALEIKDFKKLVTAAREVANLLKTSLEAQRCAMIFEGYEIDYAHVKLIPVFGSDIIEKKSKMTSKAVYNKIYTGFVSSADGHKADDSELQTLHSHLTTDPISAPRS
ncbi:uncharacterized protein [Amphiura filiformis]|uniref:uncharacterized protein n=1 Tax=Amphiura filiformis TaxID=82378 RepID=UPI003B213DB3